VAARLAQGDITETEFADQMNFEFKNSLREILNIQDT
jgi:hypothetical protein